MHDLLIYNANLVTLGEQGRIENGYLLIEKGVIAQVGHGAAPEPKCELNLDAEKMIVMPGLVDCHTHLMEYATTEIHYTYGSAQKLAAKANLLAALKSGIVALGDHHLGHPLLTQSYRDYQNICAGIPIKVCLASGCCFIGTDPMALFSSASPGKAILKKELTAEKYAEMADHSVFPGENIFLNATVANLPFDAAPRAGELTYSLGEVKDIVEIFHAKNKKIGAHLEGDQAADIFIKAGGDVIHHGHALSEKIGYLMAEKNIPLVITPHGGTRATPTTPEEALRFYRQGVKLAIASDSYLPLHPEASWINLPAGKMVGPEDYMAIAGPILKHFISNNIPVEEALKMITLNGRDILGLGGTGAIAVGNEANLIIVRNLPALETENVADIKYVICNGEIVINRAA